MPFTVGEVLEGFASRLAKPDLEKARRFWSVVASRHHDEVNRKIFVVTGDGVKFFRDLMDEVLAVWREEADEASGQQYENEFFWPLVEIINAAVAVAASVGVRYFPHFNVPKTRQAVNARQIVWSNPAISAALSTN